MIEVEQEGTNDDYFTFFNGFGYETPPEGAELTVYSQGNVTSNWVDFKCLDAGEKTPEFVECDDPNAVKIDFEGLAAGTELSDQYEGVTIEAQRNKNNTDQNDAMVFDSSNPTGGDTDLASSTQGNVLIISEDNDSSDPDDAVGGSVTFSFDKPASIYDIKVIDTEEGGTITLKDANGNVIATFDIPRIGDGEVDQVIMDVEGVSSMTVELNGSGAIDDLCFVPAQNIGPVAEDDEAAVCYDEQVVVDVLSNDSDADSDSLTITQVNGQAIAEGQTLVFDDVAVTLENGELVFDGSSAYADLVADETATDTFTYTVSDGTDTTTADVDVTFKGATDTIEKVQAELPTTATVQLIQESEDVGNGTSSDAFTIQFSDAGDLNGVFENAYCVDFFDPIDVGGHGTAISDAPLINAELTVATAENLTAEQAAELGAGGVNGESAVDNLDLINWIINQDFENTDNGDGNTTNYTDAEVQGAIWALTNGETLESFGVEQGAFVTPGQGTSSNAVEILDLAIANGEGFVAGEGDLVGVLVDPVSPDSSVQPFIVAMDLYEECVC